MMELVGHLILMSPFSMVLVEQATSDPPKFPKENMFMKYLPSYYNYIIGLCAFITIIGKKAIEHKSIIIMRLKMISKYAFIPYPKTMKGSLTCCLSDLGIFKAGLIL
jgi:hypothetical protein